MWRAELAPGGNIKLGFIGLGKLGLPVAIAITQKGHEVYGCDVNQSLLSDYKNGVVSLYEPDIANQLKEALPHLHLGGAGEYLSIRDVVRESEIIFIAVQTPHPPELDESVRFHHVRKDFDYTYLVQAAKDVAEAIKETENYKVVAIISTVLPGTTWNTIYPAMYNIIREPPGRKWGLCYNPSFIAMGQTINNFLYPEITLIGQWVGDDKSAGILEDFYNTLHGAPKLRMTWEEAEMVKVVYNTFIGLKIVLANTVMEFCHKTGADCDVVSHALSLATDRLISPKYLRGGMGDGGACHPRDALALSYHSDKLGLSYNLFDMVMTVREKQTEWIADLACEHGPTLPKVILGRTFKPDTNLVDGSCSVLLANILRERGEEVIFYDPVTDTTLPPYQPSVYIIGTNWPEFKSFKFAPGSVVIDPWRYIDEAPYDVELISVGRRTWC